MRTWAKASLVALGFLTACSSSAPCRPGTLLLTVALGAASANATQLQISVTLSDGDTLTATSEHDGTKDSDTIEVDFAKYPASQSATTTITAVDSAQHVLGRSAPVRVALLDKCETVSLEVDDVAGGSDLGVRDAGIDLRQPSDLASSDLLPPPDLSSPPDLAHATSGLIRLTGQLGGSGRLDGVGAAARLSESGGVASDGNGNLYLADTDNHVIRKLVIATGEVTTLAGTMDPYAPPGNVDGVGSAARFEGPSGIAYDGAGNLYVSDVFSGTIRKVVIASATVSTLAGKVGAVGSTDGTGAAASFNYPQGLASDGAGNLYVADTSNHTIRKVVVATGAVTTLAGLAGSAGSSDGTGSAARFDQPDGLALVGGNLYVADVQNDTLRKIALASGAVTTVAGQVGVYGGNDGAGLAATLGNPYKLASDGAGHIFISTFTDSFRVFNIATAAVTTLPVSDQHDNLYSGSLAASAGALFFFGGDAVGEVNLQTNALMVLAGAFENFGETDGNSSTARFYGNAGIVSDGAGHLFVLSDDVVRRVDAATGDVVTWAGGAPVNAADGVGSAAAFNHPIGIAYDRQGNLYIADTQNSTIRRLAIANREVTTIAGMTGATGTADGAGSAARFKYPRAIASDGAQTLYIADYSSIRQIDLSTSPATVTTLVEGFQFPAGIAYDGGGTLYVSGYCSIAKVVISTRAVTTLVGSTCGSVDGVGDQAQVGEVVGIVYDGHGHLLFADMFNATVRKVDIATTTVTTVVGVSGHGVVQPGPLPASLNAPNYLALVGNDLAITDYNEDAILYAYSP